MQATYAGLPDFLTQVVESELARIPRAFARSHPDQRWSIVYLPQVSGCCGVESANNIMQRAYSQLLWQQAAHAAADSALSGCVWNVEERLHCREIRSCCCQQAHSIIFVFIYQVGFVVRLEGGRLSEDLADFLPDYKCAYSHTRKCVPSHCARGFTCL